MLSKRTMALLQPGTTMQSRCVYPDMTPGMPDASTTCLKRWKEHMITLKPDGYAPCCPSAKTLLADQPYTTDTWQSQLHSWRRCRIISEYFTATAIETCRMVALKSASHLHLTKPKIAALICDLQAELLPHQKTHRRAETCTTANSVPATS